MWRRSRLFLRYFFSSCTLFLFSCLIYDYYWHKSHFYDQLSDENISIEQALQRIPTCTSGDRQRQRIVLTNLQAWAQLAEKHNIQYWLSSGSLVGYVQRRGLLPHDLDTDVNMMTDDMPQLIKVSKSNFSSLYEIKIQPQWNIVGKDKRSYFRDQGIHFIVPNARFIDRKTHNHVDIFPSYNFNPLYSSNLTENQPSENITEYSVSYEWFSYPRTWTYPLQTCYFSGIKLLCPAEPEKLVAAMYGVTALTKSDTKCVNGSWVRND